MQECGADLQALGDLAHAVIEHRVAGDPEDAVALPVPPKREPDYVTDDRPAQWGAVATRCGGDLDRRPPTGIEPRDRPWLDPASANVEASPTRDGGDHRAGRGQQRPAGGVEIVVVVVVAEQDGVDRSEIGSGCRRPAQLARSRAPAESIALAGRIKRRVGQQAPVADLD